MTDSASFGEWIRRRRRALDLTREALATQVGCAVVTIRKIESDERRPSRQIAERLADCLQIPADQRAAFLQAARAELAADRLPTSPPPEPPPLPKAAARAGEAHDRQAPPHALKGYQLFEQLGAGGFGTVYRATQPGVAREVAVKIIRAEYANQVAFIRRFEAEAQLVARLEHPHIVPLYDYWRERDGAYLVMRYIRGGSLQSALQSGPWSLQRCTRLLEQVGAALAFAHRHGVVHRDIKPANILLDPEGHAYLADFGIAKDLRDERPADQTQLGVIVGSPEYLSPEQIRDEPVTGQSDIFSLGILLYTVLGGAHPFANLPPAERLSKQLHMPFPPLHTLRPDLPAVLDAVLQRATAKPLTERYRDIEALLTDWLRAGQSAEPAAPHWSTTPTTFAGAVPPDATPAQDADTVLAANASAEFDTVRLENPYKGLRAFGEADAADFFGRSALTQRLLERLAEEGINARFLAVVGPSGSGKSSVVRAGLIPALRQGGIPGSEQWFITNLVPGAHPLEELELALLRIAVRQPAGLAEQLGRDERGLLRAARLILPDDAASELVLVIDQFEEVFTLVEDEAARTHFLDSLVAAATDPRSRVRVVATLRADFYDRPLRYPHLGALLRERTEVVLPLTPDELEQAIVAPARRAGVTVEPELVANIVHDVGTQPGALPLLQYALTELFEQRTGRMLTRSAYRASGGLRGALARRAEELYQALDPAGQAAARQLFLRLITLGEGVEDTRRRATRDELAALTNDERQTTNQGHTASGDDTEPSSLVEKVIDRYGRARLLTFDRDAATRAPTVEVAHEALLREWGQLREWLDASRTAVRTQRLLAGAAVEWAQQARDAGYLASGARLAQFAALAEGGDIALNAAEQAYLDASLAERDRRVREEQARQARELEQAQALAEEQRRRADEQSRAATQLRRRALVLAGVLALALIAAAIAGVFANANATLANDNATLARTNADSAATAQAAGDQALAGRATAVAEAQLRATQQALAEANFSDAQRQRLALEANSVLDQGRNTELAALLALRSLQLGYSPQADGALLRAQEYGLPQRTFSGHTDSVLQVAFSPDGRTALTASWDATARLWDVATGQELRQFTDPTAPSVMFDAVFASDGKMVLTGSEDGTARLWDAATGQELRRFTGHTKRVTSVAFSLDGRSILTCDADAIARLWDTTTGQELRQFTGHVPGICHVVFSPDGRSALTTSDGRFAPTTSPDTTARLWDVATGQELRSFAGHTDGLTRAVFSPDGRLVLTASRDKTARLWDAATGQELRRFQDTNELGRGVTFSPDGEYVLTADAYNVARLWDARTGRELRQFGVGEMSAVAISPDGNIALTAGDDPPRLWDLRAAPGSRVVVGHTIPDDLAFAAFSPDGTYALTRSDDKTARLWDVVTGRELRVFTAPDQIGSVAFSSDGKLVLAGSYDKTARLWDAASGQELRVFTGHSDQVTGVAFSPDGKYALAGSYDKTARLWDATTGQELRVFAGHTDWVISVAFSPDGKSVLTSAYDDTVRLWDVATGKELRQFSGLGGEATGAVFSSDGKSVLTASSDGTARLWDIVTGHELRRFIGHRAAVGNAVFSPDGRYIATSSADRTVRLWDRATGQELRQFIGHTLGVWGLAFTPDGKQILSSSPDGTARLWRTDLQEVIRLACTQLARDLTDDERKQYDIPNDGPTCSPT